MKAKVVYDETAESCIEILSGIHPTHTYTGEGTLNSDKSLLISFARQSFRGTPFTDRQYELAKTKINFYRQILLDNNVNVDIAIDNLRHPLRTIDRSKWIGIREKDGVDYIAVRFSFNKKLISAIESFRSKENRKMYDEVLKVHYFPLTETNIFNIVNLLKDKNFVVENDIKDKYNILEMMDKNKKDYIPGVYGFQLKNLNTKAVEYIISDIGEEPSKDNLALYKDRQALYGIEHFDQQDLSESVKNLTTLSQRIVRRQHTKILIDNKSFTIDNIAESILELNRYPLVVCLKEDDNDLEQLDTVWQSFRNIFAQEDFCCLYRKENNSSENQQFNKFIKNNNLNNSLASTSKIVYTTQNKLVKTLLKESWRPKSALVFGCSRNNKMDIYLNELDLVMYYDSDVSPFIRDIEKI